MPNLLKNHQIVDVSFSLLKDLILTFLWRNGKSQIIWLLQNARRSCIVNVMVEGTFIHILYYLIQFRKTMWSLPRYCLHPTVCQYVMILAHTALSETGILLIWCTSINKFSCSLQLNICLSTHCTPVLYISINLLNHINLICCLY